MATLLEQAQTAGTPLIEGDQVTFMWQGEQSPYLMNDITGWWEIQTAPKMAEVEPGVWAVTLTIPRNAYIEYAYAVNPEPQQDWNRSRQLDPFNPRQKSNGMGAFNNYFYMPEAVPTELIKRQKGVRAGTLTSHKVTTNGLAAGKTRELMLYKPATDEPVPLVLVLDGYDYVRQAKMPAIVDNLITQGKIPPIALLLPQNGRSARMVEYGCTDVTYGFFHYRLLPLAQQHLHLIDIATQPGAYTVMGASMGGVMSLYLGLRFPHIFGKVISQAGAFSLWGNDTLTYDLVQQKIAPDLKIWQDCGTFDFLYQANQRMRSLLQTQGYHTTYREYPTGHNYYAWRDVLPEALIWLFTDK